MGRDTEISMKIRLDEQNIPEHIEWDATDAEIKGFKQAEAVLIGLWDAEAKSALQIDLWTKKMTVQEMNLLFYQTFLTLSDTFYRATGNQVSSRAIQGFAREFIEEIKRQEEQQK